MILNGNSLILQLGKEDTYGTAVTPTNQVRVSSESLKPVYNKVDEGLLTGGRGASRKEIMSLKTEGDISTLARPDEVGLFFKAALGVESVSGNKHTFTALGTALSDSLPSLTAICDRKVDKFVYKGLKINSLSFSAAPEDYLKLDVSFVGREEATGGSLAELTPSSLKSFKFRHGKVKLAGTEVADITNINFTYNNNLDAETQTTSTGLYFKEPEPGKREITTELEMLYTAGTEAYRASYYKTDAQVGIELEFISDETFGESDTPYSLKIIIPCNQCTDASANMTGADSTKQTMSFEAVDNLTDELITVELVNDKAVEY